MTDISDEKKKALKQIIKQLHDGASPETVKEKFKEILGKVDSTEIARVEEELLKEGVQREEIRRLCDVHLAVFREQLEGQRVQAPAGHPINILMEEHRIMLQLTEKLGKMANAIQRMSAVSYVGTEIHDLEHIAEDYADSEKHYLREENVLFPMVEKHGVTEPPAIMWMEHNQIREKKKAFRQLVAQFKTSEFGDFKKRLGELAEFFMNFLPNHFFKENNILFPTALKIIPKEEWNDIRKEFDEIGYCCFTPEPSIKMQAKPQKTEKMATRTPEEIVQFENGSLSKDEIEAILDSLPIDISFVDRNDEVKYFNKAEKRIFVRTKAVIGRKVQMCHPQKSVHVVNRIVESFKTGRKDCAEFWMTLNNRLVHIRYFAVRDKNGAYLGTMEVTQDLTDMKKIEGQKRLLDWED